MAGPQSASLDALYKQLLQMQYLSRHPTGKPFYIEDWEYARGWSFGMTAGGTGRYDVVQQKSDQHPSVFNGKSMCRLYSPGLGGGYVRLAYITGPLPNGRLGSEVNFDIPYGSLAEIAARIYSFDIGFWLETGTVRRDVWARYNGEENTLQVYDGANLHTLETGLFGSPGYPFHPSWGEWHNWKFIVDFDALKLVKLYFNEKEYDLSNIPIVDAPPIHSIKWLNSYIRLAEVGGSPQYSVYLGNVILTMEEP